MKKTFFPGQTYIPASGKVFDKTEVQNAISAARDGWWTEGRFARAFESAFSRYLGARYVSLVNSGSSANLLAVAALTSPVLGNRALRAGDEYVTCAVGFPTTVNPGILYGMKPVFVDCDDRTLNIDIKHIERAITKKTKLIMIAHTLGKPFDIDAISAFSKKHNLWLVEDCCDALGSLYRGLHTGTFGDIATFSFYPAHQITMGEGGALVTNNPLIHRAIRQFRDWGRDCWCDTGADDTCGKRFGWKMGELPQGYDHKYIYSHIGYNLKLTDFQAAIGLAQLKKLPSFIQKRKENYVFYAQFFKKYGQFFDIIEKSQHDDPCWFGMPVLVKKTAPFTRNELTTYLEAHKIGTRNVFAGNLLRHPAYASIKCRVIQPLKNADYIMEAAFWIGVYPGIGKRQRKYVISTIESFLKRYVQ